MAFEPARRSHLRHERADRAERRREHAWGGKRGYLWVTLAIFLLTLAGHWAFAWPAYVQEQEEHGRPVEAGDYVIVTSRDMLENWQSEFLQLIWQVAGLSFLWYVGSPQSKEGDERKEEMLKEILREVAPQRADDVLRRLEEKYPSR